MKQLMNKLLISVLAIGASAQPLYARQEPHSATEKIIRTVWYAWLTGMGIWQFKLYRHRMGMEKRESGTIKVLCGDTAAFRFAWGLSLVMSSFDGLSRVYRDHQDDKKINERLKRRKKEAEKMQIKEDAMTANES